MLRYCQRSGCGTALWVPAGRAPFCPRDPLCQAAQQEWVADTPRRERAALESALRLAYGDGDLFARKLAEELARREEQAA